VTDIPDIAGEGVANGLHIITEDQMALEKLQTGLNSIRLGFLSLGLALGGVTGAVVGFKLAYRKAETRFAEIAAEEISEMRQHYNEKALALEVTASKVDLEELVRDRGYSAEVVDPPMAVTPPSSVMESVQDESEDASPPNMSDKETVVEERDQNVFRDSDYEDEIDTEDAWDFHEERRKRSPMRPYIIHIDEREEHQAYDAVTFTYYEADDVLCNERDEVISKQERDRLVGEVHLNQFGHGSDDPHIVYVRNDQLEMDIEIVRSLSSYAEEVHGFDPPEPEIRHTYRRTNKFDDDKFSD
jgi:hypothetical protein